MKYLLLILISFLSVIENSANNGITNAEYEYYPKYDSLSNIGHTNETEVSIMKYIGQEIIFLKRGVYDVPKFYANFDYETPVIVDTIWINIKKNKKKIKPEDYKLIYTTSYKPVYVENEEVVLSGADAYHYRKKVESDLFSYYPEGEYTKTPKRSGWFTHYSDIEGKCFKILDVKTEKVESIFKSFVFKLQSEDEQIVFWTAECNSMKHKRIAYPVVIKGYLDKIRDKYVDKDFYFPSSEYTGPKYHCVNIVFSKDSNGYLAPFLAIDDSKESQLIPLIYTPKLFNSEINNNQVFLAYTNLIDASTFEKKKDKYNEQKTLEMNEKERIAKEREKNIIKKYGSYYGKLILQGKVVIGMTKEMAKESWGIPIDINRTVTGSKVYEQWIYEGYKNYLYFENNKLTTIQN